MEFLESSVKLRRGDMTYIRFGRGEKNFVMIAGMTMAGISGLGEAICGAYKDSFASDYTVWVFERIDLLPEGCTVRDMAQDIAEAMDALGIGNADIVGASQGGMIGLYLAIDRPELVHSLVLASSCAYLDETGKATMRSWAALADACDGVSIFRDFFRRVYTSFDPAVLAAVENTVTPSQCRRFGVLARACLGFDCRAELNKIQCPVLVIAAGLDLALGVGVQRHTAELLGCECFCYETYAHAAYDEAPDYKTLLREFFDKIA